MKKKKNKEKKKKQENQHNGGDVGVALEGGGVELNDRQC
jgi:hypothetical protein